MKRLVTATIGLLAFAAAPALAADLPMKAPPMPAGSALELERLLHWRQRRLQLGALQPRFELLQSAHRRGHCQRHRRRP